ncbi:MAG: nicotinate-nucleotide adenylyltransferase [Thermomicrobiales bacterium]
MSSKIGIFGGTFDPIHIGHLIIASEICEKLELDEIRFVVAPRPPHKNGIVASDDDRVTMVLRAIERDRRFRIDLREFDRPGRSYTVDTIQSFHDEFPTSQLVFIMGEDSLLDFPSWNDPEIIVDLATIAVASRPKVDLDLSLLFERLPAARDRIIEVKTPEVAISSTLIRERLAKGESIRYLVPAEVETAIYDRSLYHETVVR